MSIYLLKENNEIGPLTTDELQALLDANCINKDQPVRLEDGTESVAGTIDGVRLAKREAPTPVLGQAQDVSVAPMGSLSRDIKGIKRNSAAVADELVHFMGELRGKSPAEMLGAFAQSTLIRSGIAATFILAAILLLSTAIPFALEGGGATENITPQPTITPEKTNSPATVPVTPEVAKSNTNEPSAVIPSEPKPVADTLGIGETKEGTPSEPNPFESTDDLLEDLE